MSDILTTKNAIRGAAVAVGYALGGPVVACAGLATGLAATRDGSMISHAQRPEMVGCRTGCSSRSPGTGGDRPRSAAAAAVTGDPRAAASPASRWMRG